MVKILADNTVKITGLSRGEINTIKQGLTLNNPAYHKAKAMGANVFGMNRYFKYFSDDGDFLEVSLGSLERVENFLNKVKTPFEIKHKFIEKKNKDLLKNSIKLRDYQEPIIQTMMSFEGRSSIVKMSTGAGKSIVALDYIQKTGLTGTIIVKDKTLLHQMIDDCKKFLGFTPGQIGDGEKEIKNISIATVQTLHIDTELCKKLAESTSVLIVDEIQEFVTENRINVIEQFKPKVVFGLTATPFRSIDDGRTDAIGFVFGEQIVDYVMKHLQPRIEVWFSGAEIPVRARYNEMIDLMIDSEPRNQLIAGICSGEIFEGKKLLILTKRVAHAKKLYDKISGIGGVYHITSGMKGKSKVLKEMKSGERPFTAIVGTMALLGTGFDIPHLDRLILAGDLKSGVLTRQSVGRILRLLDGKDPLVYDICDEKNGVLKNQFKNRRKIYRTNEWEINYHPEYLSKFI